MSENAAHELVEAIAQQSAILAKLTTMVDLLDQKVEVHASALALLEVHSENLIERVYAIEEMLDVFHQRGDVVPAPIADVPTGDAL